ncbi:MAG: hypothetical protein Q9218_005162 [Villophora microphyllina]
MANDTAQQRTTALTVPVGLDSTQYTALSFLLAIATITLPQSSVLRKGVLTLQFLCVVQAYIAYAPTDVYNSAVTYTTGILLGNLTARYIDRLYLHVPEEEFHRINEDGKKEDARTLPWTLKIWWAIELLGTTRGVGWDWRVTGIPKAKTQTRSRFLAVRFVKYIAMYTGLYLTGRIAENIRMGWPSIQSVPLRETILAITGNAMFLHLFIVAGYAIAIYSHFGLMTLPMSLVCVGLRVGPRSWQEMESWPPNFGSLNAAYSIRRFWGYTWHQQIRRIVGTPAAALLSLAPTSLLKSKSRMARLAKRYFLVIASFLVSGCIHASGSWAVTRAYGLPLSDGGELRYFLLQGVALMVEDSACWALGVDDQASRVPALRRRWAGYIVTATWYIWSRVNLKVVPLAERGHGIVDERGPLFAALQLVERNVKAVPGNFMASGLGGYTLD